MKVMDTVMIRSNSFLKRLETVGLYGRCPEFQQDSLYGVHQRSYYLDFPSVYISSLKRVNQLNGVEILLVRDGLIGILKLFSLVEEFPECLFIINKAFYPLIPKHKEENFLFYEVQAKPFTFNDSQSRIYCIHVDESLLNHQSFWKKQLHFIESEKDLALYVSFKSSCSLDYSHLKFLRLLERRSNVKLLTCKDVLALNYQKYYFQKVDASLLYYCDSYLDHLYYSKQKPVHPSQYFKSGENEIDLSACHKMVFCDEVPNREKMRDVDWSLIKGASQRDLFEISCHLFEQLSEQNAQS